MDFFDFNPGSGKPLLHLAHANGFPPATYRRSLEPLLPHYHILSFYARPFWDSRPPRTLKHWSQMADDLLQGLEGLGAKGVVGLGHSMGGATTLYAAVKRPDLLSRLILVDPTLLAPRLLRKIKWMKLLGLEARPDLVKGALRRRRRWESPEEAHQYFKSRPLFKGWPDDTVRAYAEGMTAPAPGGGTALCYPPEWEARIYQTLPMDVWKYAGLLRQPTLVLRGERSDTFTAESETAFRKANPRVSFARVGGAGHLAPQEKPLETGERMLEFLERSVPA